jgi:hypothetical protein
MVTDVLENAGARDQGTRVARAGADGNGPARGAGCWGTENGNRAIWWGWLSSVGGVHRVHRQLGDASTNAPILTTPISPVHKPQYATYHYFHPPCWHDRSFFQGLVSSYSHPAHAIRINQYMQVFKPELSNIQIPLSLGAQCLAHHRLPCASHCACARVDSADMLRAT